MRYQQKVIEKLTYCFAIVIVYTQCYYIHCQWLLLFICWVFKYLLLCSSWGEDQQIAQWAHANEWESQKTRGINGSHWEREVSSLSALFNIIFHYFMWFNTVFVGRFVIKKGRFVCVCVCYIFLSIFMCLSAYIYICLSMCKCICVCLYVNVYLSVYVFRHCIILRHMACHCYTMRL